MTKKERTILAVEELIKRYTEKIPSELRKIGYVKHCSLCAIHFNLHAEFSCRGCPVADEDGDIGCGIFAYGKYKRGSFGAIRANRQSRKAACDYRAKCYRELLKEIKMWPKERFTKKGWIYKNWDN